MFWSPSFDGMADLTPYFNHVIASYTGIQTVPHVQVKWGRLLRQAQWLRAASSKVLAWLARLLM